MKGRKKNNPSKKISSKDLQIQKLQATIDSCIETMKQQRMVIEQFTGSSGKEEKADGSLNNSNYRSYIF